MTETLESWPLPALILALWIFALLRGGAYYLLGRIARGVPGGRLDQWADRITSGYVAVAEEKVDNLGPKAIVVTYPFYGVSAATQIISGGLRMRIVAFYLALALVSLPWATMQGIVGIAALQAFAVGYAPWVLAAVGIVVVLWLGQRRRRARRAGDTGSTRAPDGT